MADIAKYSDVGYSTLKKLWPYFKKNKLVVRTRTVGKAKMYKLNRKNPVVETFIEYFWTVVDSVVNKELSKSKKNRQKFIDSGSISVPVSTRHL